MLPQRGPRLVDDGDIRGVSNGYVELRFELAILTNASVHVTVMRVVVPVHDNVTNDDPLACAETPSAVTTPPTAPLRNSCGIKC